MKTIRLRFSKDGPLRFIGHLDLLRTFQQTVRRAELPAAYSQGYNPHMRMTFALPLPLGMASVNDYMDLVLDEQDEPDYDGIIRRLTAHAPDGLTFLQAKEAAGNGAALVSAADYALTAEIDSGVIQSTLEKKIIIIPKKTKSDIKEMDIRPDILDIWKDGSFVTMRLAAGSMRFLHPLLAAGLLSSGVTAAQITRLDLYKQDLTPL
jgi:radical SAM-linked protein